MTLALIPQLAWASTGLAILLLVIAGVAVAARRWSVRAGAGGQDADETLAKFRELHARGGLSDTEYRNIQTKLAPQLSLAVAAAEQVARSREASAVLSAQSGETDNAQVDTAQGIE
ncbi:MAG: hypothetical protein ACRCT8_01480 [Lacipirellulaceae bacterium]